jgi:hypothetical protein
VFDGERTAAAFPRGPPVRAAKRTNWLLERGRAAKSSTLTHEASSFRYRSFEPAVRGTGVRRRKNVGRFPAWTACSRRETLRTRTACSHREANELAS